VNRSAPHELSARVTISVQDIQPPRRADVYAGGAHRARRWPTSLATRLAMGELRKLVPRHHGDDDVAELLPGLDVPVGLDDLLERVAPVDHRAELS
jgi:hypothetical protein